MLSLLAGSRRRHRASGDGAGFTLIETVVALAIATSVFLALAAAAITGMRASLTSQQNQQAGDLLTQTVEQLRDMDYGADGLQIASTDATLGTDSAVTACASPSGRCYDPKVGGGLEALQVSPTGQITSHQQTVSANNTTFTVSMYVTRPGAVATPGDTYGADYERVTVVTSWRSFGHAHTRRTSTFITLSMRGLPLPRFRFTNTNSLNQAFNPQSQATFGLRLLNLGARDCWTITSSDPAFTFYLDDGDGAYDGGDTLLAACPGTGSTLLEPTKASPVIWAVTTLPGTPGPYSKSVTFTATSWAQPTASTATATVTFNYSVQNTPVTGTPTPSPSTSSASPSPSPTTASPTPSPTGTTTPTTCADFPSATVTPSTPKNYTAVGYFLHNAFPNTADTTAQPQLAYDQSAPTATWLYDYATDLASGKPGRYVQSGGSGATESSAAKAIDWRVQLNQTFIDGKGTLTAWAAPGNGDPNAHGTITVYVNAITGSGATATVTPLTSQTFDAANWGCAGFKKFGVQLDFTAVARKLATNTWLDVRVEVGATPMVLAYDTTTFPAMFVMPEK